MIAPREIGRVEFYWFVVFRCIVVADVVVVIGFVFVAVLVVGVVKHFLGLLMFWFFFRMRLVFQLRWICYCCCCCISEFGY
jgi:hypothetical protein